MFELAATEKRQTPTRHSLGIHNQQPPVASRPMPIQSPPRPLAMTEKQHPPQPRPLATTSSVDFQRSRTLQVPLQKQPTLRRSHTRSQRCGQSSQPRQTSRFRRPARHDRVQIDQNQAQAGTGRPLHQEIARVQVAVPQTTVVQPSNHLGRLNHHAATLRSTQNRLRVRQQVLQHSSIPHTDTHQPAVPVVARPQGASYRSHIGRRHTQCPSRPHPVVLATRRRTAKQTTTPSPPVGRSVSLDVQHAIRITRLVRICRIQTIHRAMQTRLDHFKPTVLPPSIQG